MSAVVAFVSPTGFGNLGDAAILESLIAAVRRHRPDAQIVGFTQNPSDTRARHGIPAYALSGLAVRGYRAREVEPERPPLLERIPVARRFLRELRHRRTSAERLAGCDTVVIAGGGQLDDTWGGPFGHPYTLWRWGHLARRAGARYLVLSVGTGSLSRLSGVFVRRALRLAQYRSFRDARSRELAGAQAADPVVPDLAYGVPLPAEDGPPSAIGVSPMAFADPRYWPAGDAQRYQRHVEALAGFTARLVREGHRVLLFSSDTPDRPTLDEVRSRAAASLSPAERERLEVPAVDGVASLLALLRRCQVVVAARLHGVLLAHVAGRPALAISHERKVRTLMDELGHGRYCFEFDEFAAEAGWERFRELHARHAELAADVQRVAADYRRRVDDQYQRVFGGAR